MNEKLKLYEDAIKQSSLETGVPVELIEAVIMQESGGHPTKVGTSGEKGLMQLMPGTARALGVTDAFNPTQNISGGTRFLAQLLNKYGSDTRKVLWAYNAGEPAVDKGNVPKQSIAYADSVLGLMSGEPDFSGLKSDVEIAGLPKLDRGLSDVKIGAFTLPRGQASPASFDWSTREEKVEQTTDQIIQSIPADSPYARVAPEFRDMVRTAVDKGVDALPEAQQKKIQELINTEVLPNELIKSVRDTERDQVIQRFTLDPALKYIEMASSPDESAVFGGLIHPAWSFVKSMASASQYAIDKFSKGLLPGSDQVVTPGKALRRLTGKSLTDYLSDLNHAMGLTPKMQDETIASILRSENMDMTPEQVAERVAEIKADPTSREYIRAEAYRATQNFMIELAEMFPGIVAEAFDDPVKLINGFAAMPVDAVSKIVTATNAFGTGAEEIFRPEFTKEEIQQAWQEIADNPGAIIFTAMMGLHAGKALRGKPVSAADSKPSSSPGPVMVEPERIADHISAAETRATEFSKEIVSRETIAKLTDEELSAEMSKTSERLATATESGDATLIEQSSAEARLFEDEATSRRVGQSKGFEPLPEDVLRTIPEQELTLRTQNVKTLLDRQRGLHPEFQNPALMDKLTKQSESLGAEASRRAQIEAEIARDNKIAEDIAAQTGVDVEKVKAKIEEAQAAKRARAQKLDQLEQDRAKAKEMASRFGLDEKEALGIIQDLRGKPEPKKGGKASQRETAASEQAVVDEVVKQTGATRESATQKVQAATKKPKQPTKPKVAEKKAEPAKPPEPVVEEAFTLEVNEKGRNVVTFKKAPNSKTRALLEQLGFNSTTKDGVVKWVQNKKSSADYNFDTLKKGFKSVLGEKAKEAAPKPAKPATEKATPATEKAPDAKQEAATKGFKATIDVEVEISKAKAKMEEGGVDAQIVSDNMQWVRNFAKTNVVGAMRHLDKIVAKHIALAKKAAADAAKPGAAKSEAKATEAAKPTKPAKAPQKSERQKRKEKTGFETRRQIITKAEITPPSEPAKPPAPVVDKVPEPVKDNVPVEETKRPVTEFEAIEDASGNVSFRVPDNVDPARIEALKRLGFEETGEKMFTLSAEKSKSVKGSEIFQAIQGDPSQVQKAAPQPDVVVEQTEAGPKVDIVTLEEKIARDSEILKDAESQLEKLELPKRSSESEAKYQKRVEKATNLKAFVDGVRQRLRESQKGYDELKTQRQGLSGQLSFVEKTTQEIAQRKAAIEESIRKMERQRVYEDSPDIREQLSDMIEEAKDQLLDIADLEESVLRTDPVVDALTKQVDDLRNRIMASTDATEVISLSSEMERVNQELMKALKLTDHVGEAIESLNRSEQRASSTRLRLDMKNQRNTRGAGFNPFQMVRRGFEWMTSSTRRRSVPVNRELDRDVYRYSTEQVRGDQTNPVNTFFDETFQAPEEGMLRRFVDKIKSGRKLVDPFWRLKGEKNAWLREKLRQAIDIPNRADRDTHDIMRSILGNMDISEVMVFRKKVFLEDMREGYERYGASLPRNLSIENVVGELVRIDGMVNTNPNLAGAWARRKRLWRGVRDEMIARGWLDPAMAREDYVHHDVLKYLEDRGGEYTGRSYYQKSVKDYLVGRTGKSISDYATDYVQVEFATIRQVLQDKYIDDAIDRIGQTADISPRLYEQARQMREVGDQRNLVSIVYDNIPEGYSLWRPEMKLPKSMKTPVDRIIMDMLNELEPELKKQYVANLREIAAERLGRSMTDAEGLKLQHQADWLEGRYDHRGYIVPTELLETLKNFREDFLSGTLPVVGKITGKLKRVLIQKNPIKYNRKNLVGDVDHLLSGMPEIVKHRQELVDAVNHALVYHKTRVSPDDFRFKLAIDRGVIDAARTQAEYNTGRMNANELRDLMVIEKNAFQSIKDLPEAYSHLVSEWSSLRERVFRLWAFYANISRIRGSMPIYEGVSELTGLKKWSAERLLEGDELASMDVQYDMAAKVSREILGDYGSMTPFENKVMRGFLAPFYSWYKINTTFYPQLIARKGLRGVARTAPFAAARTAMSVGATVAKSSIGLMVAADLWNNFMYPDIERGMPDDQREKFHVIVDDDQGNPLIWTDPTAFSEFLDQTGLSGLHMDVIKTLTGEKSPIEAAVDAGSEFLKNIPVEAYGAFNPAGKGIIGGITGLSSFPDPTDPILTGDAGWRGFAREAGLQEVAGAVDLAKRAVGEGDGRYGEEISRYFRDVLPYDIPSSMPEIFPGLSVETLKRYREAGDKELGYISGGWSESFFGGRRYNGARLVMLKMAEMQRRFMKEHGYTSGGSSGPRTKVNRAIFRGLMGGDQALVRMATEDLLRASGGSPYQAAAYFSEYLNSKKIATGVPSDIRDLWEAQLTDTQLQWQEEHDKFLTDIAQTFYDIAYETADQMEER